MTVSDSLYAKAKLLLEQGLTHAEALDRLIPPNPQDPKSDKDATPESATELIEFLREMANELEADLKKEKATETFEQTRLG